MNFGEYMCYPLDLGDFMVDGGAFFGTIPKSLWQQKMPADKENLIRIKSRALLIIGGGRTILVDAGFGTTLDDGMKREYGIGDTVPDMNLVLSGYDIDASQVTDVILTHLHFDHAGGAMISSDIGPMPAFPNATYHVQADQWAAFREPHERERESLTAVDYSNLEAYGVLNQLNGSLSIADGIEIMVSYGHTQGQQHVLVRDPQQSLFFCSDLIPTAAHIPVAWHSAYDMRPVELYPEKDYFLRKAFRENWILFFAHDPKIEAATLKEGPEWMALDREVSF